MTTFASALRLHAVAEPNDTRLDEAVALRRCAQYRKAFRGSAVSYPAEVLSLDAPAAWIRRHGVSADVDDADELETALSVGIDPFRVIMHQADGATGPLQEAVDAGVGRVVVRSATGVAALAAVALRRQRVLVEVTERPVGAVVDEIVACERLELIGLHRRLAAGEPGAAIVRMMIDAMMHIARRYGVIPARLSLSDVDVANWGCDSADIANMSAAIDEAVESGCIASRFARPAMNVSPSPGALLPVT